MSKYCGYCGAKMPDQAKVCGACGKPFAGEKPPSSASPEIPSNLQDVLRALLKLYREDLRPLLCNLLHSAKEIWELYKKKILSIFFGVLFLYCVVTALSTKPSAGTSSQTPLASSESNSEGASSKSGKKKKLSDYGENMHFSYEHPNIEELSVVRVAYDGDNFFYALVDKDGKVAYTYSDIWAKSGFYNGMCFMNNGMMMDVHGNLFRPDYLDEEEEILQYFKEGDSPILWTVQFKNTIDDSKTILRARDKDGKVIYQGDSSQDGFSEMSPSWMYQEIGEYGICQIGNGEYSIRSSTENVFFNIYDGNAFYKRGAGMTTAGDQFFLGSSLVDSSGRSISSWGAVTTNLMKSTPILQENLIFFKGHSEDVKYPFGFYDIDLNLVIDLSKYDIETDSYFMPRFINGYAVLQMYNSQRVPFYGVLNHSGNWCFEPREGVVRYVYPVGDGLLISTVPNEDSDQYTAYDENGNELGEELAQLEFVTRGITASPYELYDGSLYITARDMSTRHARIVRIDPNYKVHYLS